MTELSVALVGCGAIAVRAHVPALAAAGARIAVLASRSRSSAKAAAAAAGGGDVTTSWEDAIARDDVNAVVICTPNVLHEPIAVAAAEAGKHVLVEKPMATTLAAADRMIAAATASGVALVPAHNVRFAPPFAAAADAVRAGAIGQVTGVRAAFGHAGPQQWAPDASWFRDPDQAGGGALLDLGVHVADLLRAVVGDEVVSVSANVHTAAGIDDDAQALCRFAGGASGTFHASWIARPGPDHQLTVFGTEGTLHVDGRTALTRFPADGSPLEKVPLPARETDDEGTVGGTQPGPVRELVRAAAGLEPRISARDGRAALAIVLAAYDAASTGQVTEVDLP